MFCPGCGSEQSGELKFCKLCGANLYAVRQVMATRESDDNLTGARRRNTWGKRKGKIRRVTYEMTFNSSRVNYNRCRQQTICARLQINSPGFPLRLNYRQCHAVKCLAMICFE